MGMAGIKVEWEKIMHPVAPYLASAIIFLGMGWQSPSMAGDPSGGQPPHPLILAQLKSTSTAPKFVVQPKRAILRLTEGTKVVKTGRNKGNFVKERAITGTFVCGCRKPGTGSCTLSQGSDRLLCTNSTGDTCSTSCQFATTTISTRSAAPFTMQRASP